MRLSPPGGARSSRTSRSGRVDSARVARYGRAASRWARLLASGRASPGLRVFYGWDAIPAPGEPVAGGTAKLQKLAARWPNRPTDFSLLYLGTTYLPRDLRPLLWLARRRRAPIVVNQDGVAYPGWAGERTDELNVPLRRAVLAADHVVYQSAFSKRSSDAVPRRAARRVGGPPERGRRRPVHAGPGARRTGRSSCSAATRRRRTGSSSGSRPSATSATSTPDARLLVAGRLVSDPAPTLDRLGLGDAVEFLGRYAQTDAPAIVPPRPRPAAHEGQRPVPDRRDRGDGMRRPRRVPGERRDGRARRRRGGRRASRIPTASSATSRRRAEALAAAVSTILADRERLCGAGAGAGGRAVRAHGLARAPCGDLRARSCRPPAAR